MELLGPATSSSSGRSYGRPECLPWRPTALLQVQLNQHDEAQAQILAFIQAPAVPVAPAAPFALAAPVNPAATISPVAPGGPVPGALLAVAPLAPAVIPAGPVFDLVGVAFFNHAAVDDDGCILVTVAINKEVQL